uniref:Ketoreductase (KR) domain-containing protein n=1 Tax=Bionectria ochroleuca TaxID=29856 RepID=A0A8H7KEX6_BIOOC
MTSADIFQLRAKDNSVAGRLALVTGASGGIGSHCAIVREPWLPRAATLPFIIHPAAADALASELRAQYPGQLFVPCRADLSSREATRDLVPNLLQTDVVAAKHKTISILVANAGLGRRIRDVADIEESDWDDMFEVNTRSPFVVVKSAVAGMRAQNWGRIVLVGSLASQGKGLNGCHYAASKGALSSMGRNLANLLALEGVSPAMIASTGMIPLPKAGSWDRTAQSLDSLRNSDPGLAIASTIPVARLGTPDEVAQVTIMFAKTGYLTGQDVHLNGGLH